MGTGFAAGIFHSGEHDFNEWDDSMSYVIGPSVRLSLRPIPGQTMSHCLLRLGHRAAVWRAFYFVTWLSGVKPLAPLALGQRVRNDFAFQTMDPRLLSQ